MFRYCLTLLLLLPYLLGLGAGLVGRPEPAAPTAVKPYVHSPECQRQNYLRVDCFNTCNGNHQAVQAQHKADTPAQLLASFKSIDLHCLPEAPRMLCRKPLLSVSYQPRLVRGVLPGVRLGVYQPPRQG